MSDRNLSALRSTFEGDSADFASALDALRGNLSGVSSDLAAIADSVSARLPADAAASSSVVLNGPISIYGVQDVESLYDQLTAEARRRNV
jgi:hypothetical protein